MSISLRAVCFRSWSWILSRVTEKKNQHCLCLCRLLFSLSLVLPCLLYQLLTCSAKVRCCRRPMTEPLAHDSCGVCLHSLLGSVEVELNQRMPAKLFSRFLENGFLSSPVLTSIGQFTNVEASLQILHAR